jgi:hypothetical protein
VLLSDCALVAAKGRCDSWLTLEFSAIQGPVSIGMAMLEFGMFAG